MAELQRSSRVVRTLAMDPLQLSLLVSAPFVAVFALINFLLDLNDLAYLESGMVVTLSVIYLWGRRSGATAWLSNLYIVHVALLFALLFQQGGYNDMGFIWSLGFPFIACLAGGSRIGTVWTLIYAVTIAVIALVLRSMSWPALLTIGLGYIAFAMIAIYSVLYRERIDEVRASQLDETSHRLRREEIALADSRKGHRALLDSMPMPVGICAEGRWKYCNHSAALLLGRNGPETLIGRALLDDVDQRDRQAVAEFFNHMSQSHRPDRLSRVRLSGRDCEPVEIEMHVSPVRLEGAEAELLLMRQVVKAEPAPAAREKRQPESSQQPKSVSGNGRGKVLVADDDLRVRMSGAAMLEALGFEAVAVEDGRQAVDAYKQHNPELVAVLLDMSMPVMSGTDAMAVMRRINASVPVLMVTGYSEAEARELVSGERPNGFVQKPFKPDVLKRAIHEVMHSG